MKQTSEMIALRAHRRGGPEELRVDRVSRPMIDESRVLVEVHAAAVTFNELLWEETWTRDGRARLPIIPSHEWSGVVVDANSDTSLQAGDEVFGMVPFDRDGAAAEYVSVSQEFIAPKPMGLTHAEAAALPLAGLTAWQALHEHAHVKSGDRVLVLGAAGGVGALGTQLALASGARVTATAMERDVEYVNSLGVDDVVASSRRGSHGSELRQGSYDVVLDTVGGSLIEQSLGFTRRGGTFITLQQPPPLDVARSLGVEGVFFVVSSGRAALDRLRESVDGGDLRVTVAATYSLADGRAAYASGGLSPRAPGKTVLLVKGVKSGEGSPA